MYWGPTTREERRKGAGVTGATLEAGRILGSKASVIHGVNVVGLTLIVTHIHEGGRVDLHLALQFVPPDLPLVYLRDEDR